MQIPIVYKNAKSPEKTQFFFMIVYIMLFSPQKTQNLFISRVKRAKKHNLEVILFINPA